MAFTMYNDNGKMAFKSGRTKGPYQKDLKGHWRANVQYLYLIKDLFIFMQTLIYEKGAAYT